MKYFFKDLRHYIFQDAKPFLGKIGKRNLFLISYGDKEIQMEKIQKAGMGDHFNQIVITTNKIEAIKKILKEEKKENKKMYFLDDKGQYIEEVKKALPKITAILVKRLEGRYQNEPNKMADVVVEKLIDYHW